MATMPQPQQQADDFKVFYGVVSENKRLCFLVSNKGAFLHDDLTNKIALIRNPWRLWQDDDEGSYWWVGIDKPGWHESVKAQLDFDQEFLIESMGTDHNMPSEWDEDEEYDLLDSEDGLHSPPASYPRPSPPDARLARWDPPGGPQQWH